MTGPTLLDDYLDAALPVEPPPGPQPAAEEITRLIQNLRPAIETILRQFAIPPAEAWIVLQPMIAYAGLHWGETLDPAPWLIEILRANCREHQVRRLSSLITFSESRRHSPAPPVAAARRTGPGRASARRAPRAAAASTAAG